MAMQVEVVSAETKIFSGEADFVVATATDGEMGIKPGHAPLLAALKPGEVRVVLDENKGTEEIFYVSSGFIEVQPESVIVLADTAQRADDVDEAQALEAKARAEKMLVDTQGELEYAKARAELARAAAQLRAIRRMRDRKHS